MEAYIQYRLHPATSAQFKAENNGTRLPVYVESGTISEPIGTADIAYGEGDTMGIAYQVDAGSAQALEFGSLDMTALQTKNEHLWEFTGVLVEYRQVQAAVRTSGWADLPIAARDRQWDSAAADRRISVACGIGGDNPDWSCYASAHLFRDDDANPETKTAYKMLIVDQIDGERQIVPRAVFAAAGALQGARDGLDAPAAAMQEMRSVLSGIYRRMAEHFDDDIRAPWDED